MERIKLYAKNIHTGCDKVVMECHLPPKNPDNPEIETPAVIIFPGGGYAFCSEREATPVANVFLAQGYAAFVVRYTLAPECEVYNPLLDAAMSVHTVRTKADEFGVDPNKIAVCGFSAGGHLVASLGVHWNHPDVIKYSGISDGSNRPNGIILGYPVITGEEGRTHMGTINNFIGGRDSVEPLAWLEKHVSDKTPLAFIWHTYTDNAVPVVSALRFANALEENNVKFEMHIYPDGQHGLATSDYITCTEGMRVPAVTNWIDMSVRWINDFKEQ